LTAPNEARAGVDALPDAATILDKYVEVTGGEAAYERIHNRVTKGHHEFVGMGLKGTQTYYQAQPNKVYSELEAEALGKVESGTDGKVAWYVSPSTGPLVETGDARTVGLSEAAFDREVYWRKYYKKAECVGEEVVEGKGCYKIVLTPEVGEPETRYYDKESNLLVRTDKMRLSSHMPSMAFEIMVDDYRRVDGLLLAHKRKQVMQGCGGPVEIVFVTDSIEHNVDLPSNRFDLPEKIQELASSAGSSAGGCCPGGGGSACGGSGKAAGSAPCCAGGGGGGACGGSAETAGGASSGGGCGGSGRTVATQEKPAKPQQTQGACGSGS
jgi:hypothetical protein